VTDDIVLNKSENIERCIKRVKQTYHGNEKKLLTDYTVQDVIILNLQRACEATIDMAMHFIKIKKLGVPKDSRDAFTLLEAAHLIPKELSDQLANMVGFRNIIIHEYTKINYNIVNSVILKDMNGLLDFCKMALQISSSR